MKVYSMRQKYFIKKSVALPESEKGVPANTVQGNPKTNIENFHKSIGGTLLNSLNFTEPTKKKSKSENIKFIF